MEAEIAADMDIPLQGDVPGLGALRFGFREPGLGLRGGWNCQGSGRATVKGT